MFYFFSTPFFQSVVYSTREWRISKVIMNRLDSKQWLLSFPTQFYNLMFVTKVSGKDDIDSKQLWERWHTTLSANYLLQCNRSFEVAWWIVLPRRHTNVCESVFSKRITMPYSHTCWKRKSASFADVLHRISTETERLFFVFGSVTCQHPYMKQRLSLIKKFIDCARFIRLPLDAFSFSLRFACPKENHFFLFSSATQLKQSI